MANEIHKGVIICFKSPFQKEKGKYIPEAKLILGGSEVRFKRLKLYDEPCDTEEEAKKVAFRKAKEWIDQYACY